MPVPTMTPVQVLLQAAERIQPPWMMPWESGDLDVAGLLALGASRNVEIDALAFGQALEARGLNRGKVGEEIIAAFVGRNEAKTFGIVKPLYSTF